VEQPEKGSDKHLADNLDALRSNRGRLIKF